MRDTESTVEPSRRYHAPDDPRLPRFASYAEEAAFWERHDFETLEPLSPEELAERTSIESELRSERSSTSTRLTVLLDRPIYDALVEAARERGVEPATLAGAWLDERLRLA